MTKPVALASGLASLLSIAAGATALVWPKRTATPSFSDHASPNSSRKSNTTNSDGRPGHPADGARRSDALD